MRTYIEGDPDEIEAVAAYLRHTLAAGERRLADIGAGQRVRLAGGWEGDSGAAFNHQAALLVEAADELAEHTEEAATEFDGLASALRTAQNAMRELRWRAIAAGLSTTETDIVHPVGSRSTPSPISGQPGTWSLLEAYRELQAAHEDAMLVWESALHGCAGFLRREAGALSSLGVTLISGGFTGALLVLNSPIMQKQATWLTSEADRLRWLAQEHMDLAREGRVRFNPGEYDDLLGRSDAAREAGRAAKEAPPPRGLTRFGHSINVLSTGYGVYADIQAGESATQAVASQSAGLTASVATAALIGSPGGPVGMAGVALLSIAAGLAMDALVDRTFEAHGDHQKAVGTGVGDQRQLSPRESRVSLLLGGPGYVPDKISPAA